MLEDNDFNILECDANDISDSQRTIAGFDKLKLLEVAELVNIAYSDPKELASFPKGFEVKPFRDPESNHLGNVYIKGSEAIICYRGTWDESDVFSDIDAFKTIPAFLNNIGRVHVGFYRKYKESHAQINKILQESTIPEDVLELIVAGHSMGAAVATILALALKTEKPRLNIRVATFGSPRAFDFFAAAHYAQLLGDKTIRVVQHHIDPVTTVLTGTTGYKHVGQQLRAHSTNGDYPHQLDGYVKFIKSLPDEQFISQNSASPFWIVSYPIGIMESVVVGGMQQIWRTYFKRPQRKEPDLEKGEGVSK